MQKILGNVCSIPIHFRCGDIGVFPYKDSPKSCVNPRKTNPINIKLNGEPIGGPVHPPM